MRTTLETHDGALIYVTHKGIWDLGEKGYENVLRGNTLPDGLHIRTTPTFHTSHPAYQWLPSDALPDDWAGISEAEVRCDVYAVM